MRMRSDNDVIIFIYLYVDQENLILDTVNKAHCPISECAAILCAYSLYLLQVSMILIVSVYSYQMLLILSLLSPLYIVQHKKMASLSSSCYQTSDNLEKIFQSTRKSVDYLSEFDDISTEASVKNRFWESSKAESDSILTQTIYPVSCRVVIRVGCQD